MPLVSFDKLSTSTLKKHYLTDEDYVFVKPVTVADLIELQKRGNVSDAESIAVIASRSIVDENGKALLTEDQVKALPLDVLGKLGEAIKADSPKN